MYITILKFLFPYIIGAIIAGGITWKIQEIRIDNLKNINITNENNLKECQNVNENNLKTTEKLKEEIKNINNLCKKTIGNKNNTIKKIKDIENIGTRNEKNSNGDIITDMLNGMFTNTTANN